MIMSCCVAPKTIISKFMAKYEMDSSVKIILCMTYSTVGCTDFREDKSLVTV